MTGRQDMWMAHFTAACEVACRLSPTVAPNGVALSRAEPLWVADADLTTRPPDAPPITAKGAAKSHLKASPTKASPVKGAPPTPSSKPHSAGSPTRRHAFGAAQRSLKFPFGGSRELGGSASARPEETPSALQAMASIRRSRLPTDRSSQSESGGILDSPPPPLPSVRSSSLPLSAAIDRGGGDDESEAALAASLADPTQLALERMREMGFEDVMLNRDVLAACSNDESRAIALLLGEDPSLPQSQPQP